jgi:hypothetical protein
MFLKVRCPISFSSSNFSEIRDAFFNVLFSVSVRVEHRWMR